MQRRGLKLPNNDRVIPTCPEWAHEDQRSWYDSDCLTNIGLAGAQGGKTAMLPHILLKRVVAAAPLARKLGRADALFIGPTLELLGAQAIPAFRLLWEEQLRLGRMVMGGKPKFHLSESGSRRLFGEPIPGVVHCAYANDSSNLESLTALAAAWDEAGQKENKEASFHAVLRRLTVARSHGYGHLDIGTTPYEWGWLKRLVVDQADGVKSVIHNWPSWCNPNVSREEVESRRDNMPLWAWEMMYLGRYTKPAGVVYDCFDSDNIIEPFEVPRAWPLYLGLDFGLINTAGVIIAEELKKDWLGHWTDEPTGNYFLIGTYHAGQSKTAKEHLRAVRDIADSLVMGGAAQRPTAVGGSHMESGWRESWSLSGLGVAEPSILKVDSQIACLYAAFKTKKLKVFRTCSKFIEEAETFAYELDDAGEPTEKFDDTKFHRLSGARYIATRLFKTVERSKAPTMKAGFGLGQS